MATGSLVIGRAAGDVGGPHTLAMVELIGWVPGGLYVQQLGVVTPVPGRPVRFLIGRMVRGVKRGWMVPEQLGKFAYLL